MQSVALSYGKAGADMTETEPLVTIEVDDETLEEASRIAERFGLDLPLVSKALYKQIVREGRIPLNLSYPKPNDESLEAIRETEGLSLLEDTVDDDATSCVLTR